MKNELLELVKILANEYSADGHYEIINAEKLGDGWRLDIKRIDEGAANESE